MVNAVCVRGQDNRVSPRRPSQIFAVRAKADPGSLPRVIAPFGQRNIIPVQLVCRRAGCFLIIDLEVDHLGEELAELLLQKLRSLVLVDHANIVGQARK